MQGDFSIWSHASAIDYPTGKLACTAGQRLPDRDIYVRWYSMDPERIDVGHRQEFGHAAFGLPDIYTTDAQASPSNWTIVEAGSWNGPVAACRPRRSRSSSAICRLGQSGRARRHDRPDHREGRPALAATRPR